jgi:hypothetical protein
MSPVVREADRYDVNEFTVAAADAAEDGCMEEIFDFFGG